jgi:FkbM family methyltransferase
MSRSKFLLEIRAVHDLVMSKDYWGGIYEELTVAIYSAVLGRGDSAVDCGVNLGDHLDIMTRYTGPDTTVFAFEAAPPMMEHAKKRIHFPGVRWIAEPVWHTAGEELRFEYFPVEHGLSGIKAGDSPSGVSSTVPYTLKSTTLDEEIDRDVVLIKLDIEGAEYNALKGARRVLRESMPVIVFENSRQPAADRFGYTKDDFFGLFHDAGYNLYFITGMPFLEELWADSRHPWQFLALHPASPRAPRALAATHALLSNLRANQLG